MSDENTVVDVMVDVEPIENPDDGIQVQDKFNSDDMLLDTAENIDSDLQEEEENQDGNTN